MIGPALNMLAEGDHAVRTWGRTTYLVVDTDAHYSDAVLEMVEYMDEPWRDRIKHTRGLRWIPGTLGDGTLEGQDPARRRRVSDRRRHGSR